LVGINAAVGIAEFLVLFPVIQINRLSPRLFEFTAPNSRCNYDKVMSVKHFRFRVGSIDLLATKIREFLIFKFFFSNREEFSFVTDHTNEQILEENNELSSANLSLKIKRSKIKLFHRTYMTGRAVA